MQDGLPAADHVHMTQIHLVTAKMRCNVYILAFACNGFQNSLVMLKAITVTHVSADCRIQSSELFCHRHNQLCLSQNVTTCFDQLHDHPQATRAPICRPTHSGDGFDLKPGYV